MYKCESYFSYGKLQFRKLSQRDLFLYKVIDQSNL